MQPFRAKWKPNGQNWCKMGISPNLRCKLFTGNWSQMAETEVKLPFRKITRIFFLASIDDFMTLFCRDSLMNVLFILGFLIFSIVNLNVTLGLLPPQCWTANTPDTTSSCKSNRTNSSLPKLLGVFGRNMTAFGCRPFSRCARGNPTFGL